MSGSRIEPKVGTEWQDQVLAARDDTHQVYLCEYNIIHLNWGKNRLVYCPGDFMGLPFLLSPLNKPCSKECARGEACPGDHGDGIVRLQYGSVEIPIPRGECHDLHLLVSEGVKCLLKLQHQGYFHNRSQRQLAEMLDA
mgnify:CR=1 FL=1